MADAPQSTETIRPPIEHDEPSGDDRTLEEATEGEVPGGESSIDRGTQLGRYLVLRPLGRGGMGLVFLADDPELDRKVAIKILRPDRAPGVTSADGRVRLLREAQAIARLAHPNVIAVYDVGTFEEGVFVAMEYVRGVDLREWLSKRKPDVGEILDLFISAGRGIVAAHDAGIVHRDVKPANILVGDDGRVRVMDFGLARAAAEDSDGSTAELAAPGEVPSSVLSSPVTMAGVVMGTPAYMAPEQAAGTALSPKSDQFAFCVALFEAIYRVRPFAGDTLEERIRSIARGVTFPPKSVPGRLRSLLSRGLQADPGDRYSSMSALIEDLVRARARGRLLLSATVVAGSGLLAVAGYASFIGGETPCDRVSEELGSTWGPARSEQLRAAFEQTEVAFAIDAWEQARQRIEDFADTWLEMRREVCEATVIRREQSGAEMDLRLTCLELQRQQFDALLASFEQTDAEVVTNAVSAAAALPDVSDCADQDALARLPPIPRDPKLREQVVELRAQIAEILASRRAGRPAQAIEVAANVEARLADIEYAPVEAEYALEMGLVHALMERREQAESDLRRGLRAAARGQHLVARARIELALARLLGSKLRRFEAGDELVRSAAATLAGLGDPLDLRAELVLVAGDIAFARDDYVSARESIERLLELDARTVERDAILQRLGSCLAALGEHVEAAQTFRRALAIREDRFGSSHPLVADSAVGLSASLQQLQEFDEAEALIHRAYGIRRDTFGEDSLNAAETKSQLGVLALRRKRYDEARRHLEAAVDVIMRQSEQVDFDAGSIVTNLGAVYSRQGDHARAREMHEYALELIEGSVGPDHPRTVIPSMNLAAAWERDQEYEKALPWRQRVVDTLENDPSKVSRTGDMLVFLALDQLQLDRLAEAERNYRDALARYERDRLSPYWRDAWFGLGQIALARKHHRDAVACFERVLSPKEGLNVAPKDLLYETHFGLARSQWALGERKAAVAHAREARAEFLASDLGSEQGLREIDAWLRRHRG